MKNTRDTTLTISADYRQFIEELKARVTAARTSAARAVNNDAILLYWDIGRRIVGKQKTRGWGDSVVEMISADLRRAFPGMRGFSANNVWLMRQFFSEYSAAGFLEHLVQEMGEKGRQILRQPVAELVLPDHSSKSAGPSAILEQLVQELLPAVPWGHHIEIVKKVKAPAARLWYLRATARFGWSRNVLLNQIKASDYERAVTEKKTHNFPLALPEHFAGQADEMLKSTYNLESLGLRRAGPKARLYSSLGQRPRYLIRRKPRAVSPIHLWRCRAGMGRAFSPRASLSVIPGALPQAGIDCAFGARDIGVAFHRRSKANPIGVAVYELQSKLPGELKGKLPTAKQLADIVRVEMEGER